MKPVIFTIEVESIVDLITNSSSELFVFEGESKKKVLKLIKEAYPEYLNEYHELKTVDDMSQDELETYIDYQAYYHGFKPFGAFTQDELYEEDPDFTWNKYRVKNNIPDQKWGRFVTKKNIKWVRDKIDPTRKLFFLFSLDENPRVQAPLEMIGHRYHLG